MTPCRHRYAGWCAICKTVVPRPVNADIKVLWQSGAITGKLAIALLARTFHSLDKFDFDSRIDKMDGLRIKGMFKEAFSSGERHALAFVLSVWNADAARRMNKRYRFDLHAAMGCWDDQNRGAFAAWCANPWSP